MHRSPRSGRATASRPSEASFPLRRRSSSSIGSSMPACRASRRPPSCRRARCRSLPTPRRSCAASTVPAGRCLPRWCRTSAGRCARPRPQVDEMVVFVSASESHNRKNVNREIEESLAGFEDVARVAGGSRDARVRRDLDRVRLPVRGRGPGRAGGRDRTPLPAARVHRSEPRRHHRHGDAATRRLPPSPRCAKPRRGFGLGLHFHNTRGIGLANVMAGLELGVGKYEGSFGGIGGCPFAPKATGNICTEDLVYLLEEMGIGTGIDSAQALGYRLRRRSRGGPRAARTDHESGAEARPPLDGFRARGARADRAPVSARGATSLPSRHGPSRVGAAFSPARQSREWCPAARPGVSRAGVDGGMVSGDHPGRA